MKKVKNILPSILYLLIFILILIISILLILNTKGVKSSKIYRKVIGERVLKTYELKEGVNLIGTDFNSKDKAARIIKNNPDISVIGDFDNSGWKRIVKKSSSRVLQGKNFKLKQGKGYLVISNKDIQLKLEGRRFERDTNTTLDKGLNLINASSYTHMSRLIQDFENKDIQVLGVSSWSNSLSNFVSYVQDSGDYYGTDNEINPNSGVFINVE